MIRKLSTAVGNPAEMAHFAELAESWWNPNGPQRILHKMNLMRVDFMRETLAQNRPNVPGYAPNLMPAHMQPPVSSPKLDVLDIGCGGGLLSESMARLPFVNRVLGVDVTPEVVEVAETHRQQDPILTNLKYELRSAESLTEKFDMVTMYEVLEHLDIPRAGIDTALSLVKPGGWCFMSTINRTVAAYLSTIFLGEYVLGIVPKGTHTWKKYINESELRSYVEENHPQWQVARTQGCIYLPTQGWVRFDSTSEGPKQVLNCAIGRQGGNYLMALRCNG